MERIRQWKYRFAQSVVFGIPVFALHFLGPRLGGPEAARWVGLFEAILAGWVLYVGALGMICDALVRRRITAHLVVAFAAIGAYAAGLVAFFASLQKEKTPGLTRGFLVATCIVVLWTALVLVMRRRAYSE